MRIHVEVKAWMMFKSQLNESDLCALNLRLYRPGFRQVFSSCLGCHPYRDSSIDSASGTKRTFKSRRFIVTVSMPLSVVAYYVIWAQEQQVRNHPTASLPLAYTSTRNLNNNCIVYHTAYPTISLTIVRRHYQNSVSPMIFGSVIEIRRQVATRMNSPLGEYIAFPYIKHRHQLVQ